MSSAKHLACVTLLAFLFNALLPFLAVYNAPSHVPVARQLSSIFGDKLLICTGEGFKWVRLQDLQNQKPHNDTPDHIKCPLCYIAAHGLFAITPEQPALSLPVFPQVASTTYYYRPAAFHLQFTLGSRAPPAPFFSQIVFSQS